MTIERMFNENHDFGEWIRNQKRIDSKIHGLTVNDIDWILYKYKDNVKGGGKDIQLMMCIETKTRNGEPSWQQHEVLFLLNQILYTKKERLNLCGKKLSVWHFGFFVLKMSGTSPQNSTDIYWGIFDKNGKINYHNICKDKLIDILGFNDDPVTLKKIDLRRHHSKKILLQKYINPMELNVYEKVIKKS